MSSTAFLIVGIIALLLLGGAIITVTFLIARTRQQSEITRRLVPTGAPAADEFAAAQSQPLLQNLARGGRALEGWVDTDNESARLMLQAGWRSTEARMFWYVFQILIPLLGVCGVLLFWILGGEENKPLLLLAGAFGAFALSILIPRWVLRSAAEKRRARIKAEVPLFIHLLVLLFEAGLSTRQAFSSLVREGGGVLRELSVEFDLLLRQLEAGADTSEVLKSMSDALAVEDLTNVLGVLRQVDRYGGEVREPLLESLQTLEQRRSLDLREQVNLMSGRMTVVMVLFFFPALLIFVAGPAFLAIIRALGNVAGK